MFDAETKFAALERRITALEKEVAALKRKQRGTVAASGDPLPNSGGGPGEEQDTPGP